MQADKAKYIYLVRHAANDWIGKRLAGWTPGVHLNEIGRRQALALAERLADMPGAEIVAVYSSPLERARETAQPIVERLGVHMHIIDELGEVQYGEWTGHHLETLKEKPLWQVVQRWPSAAHFPGGESLRVMQCRAVGAVEAVLDHLKEQQGAVLVSHSDVIKAIVAHYLGLHLDLFQRLVISPASLTAIRVTDTGPRVLCVNDTAHVPLEDQQEDQRSPT